MPSHGVVANTDGVRVRRSSRVMVAVMGSVLVCKFRIGQRAALPPSLSLTGKELNRAEVTPAHGGVEGKRRLQEAKRMKLAPRVP